MATANGEAQHATSAAETPTSPVESALETFLDATEHVDEDFASSTVIADLHELFHEVEQHDDDDDDEAHVPLDDYEHIDIGKIDFSVFKLVWSQKSLVLRDKLAFLLGSTELWLCAYWLGRWPDQFYRLYTVQAVTLGVARWVLYRRRGWHYYLFDFCYYANILLLVHLWLLPTSAFLRKILFAYTNGPLAWSILAFRNSLVYHDLDKVTSLFLHLAPLMVAWTLRWHPNASFHFPHSHPDGSITFSDDAGKAGLMQLVVVPMVPYLLWAVLYYLKIFVISASKIQQRNYATLFKYLTNTTKKTAFTRLVHRVPQRLQPVTYLALHLLFSLATFCLSVAFWHSYTLHSAFVMVMGSLAIWHGATYYFEVFAKKYIHAVAARAAAGGLDPAADGQAAVGAKKTS